MYCIYCGQKNPDGANFCSQCGKKLVSGPEDIRTTPETETSQEIPRSQENQEEKNANWNPGFREEYHEESHERSVKPMAVPPIRPVGRPVAKPVAGPHTGPVARPMSEPVARPVAESVARPVAESAGTPAVNPGKPKVDVETKPVAGQPENQYDRNGNIILPTYDDEENSPKKNMGWIIGIIAAFVIIAGGIVGYNFYAKSAVAGPGGVSVPVDNFAMKFAKFVNTNEKDSVKNYYRDFSRRLETTIVPVGDIKIRALNGEGEYEVVYSPDLRIVVKVDEDGEMMVAETYGLYNFDPAIVSTAKDEGMIDMNINDFELSEKMRDDKFVEKVKKKVKSGSVAQSTSAPGAIAIAEEALTGTPKASSEKDYSNGTFDWKGNVHTPSGDFPIKLAIKYSGGMIKSATYYNIKYNVTIPMSTSSAPGGYDYALVSDKKSHYLQINLNQINDRYMTGDMTSIHNDSYKSYPLDVSLI